MDCLPRELHSELLSYLSADELINARCVSYEWKEIIKYHHPIIEKFDSKDWHKYIKILCGCPGIISRYYEKIPLLLLSQVPVWCAEKGNLDDLHYCDQIVSVRFAFDDISICEYSVKIKNYLKKRYPNVDHFGYFYPDGGLIHMSPTDLNLHIQRLIWRDSQGIKKLIESDNGERPIPMWKEYVNRLVDGINKLNFKCIGHTIIQNFVNTGNMEVVRYVAELTNGMKFNKVAIGIPNEEIIHLFKNRTKSKSIIKMMELGRHDLANLIIELDTNCFPGFIGQLSKNKMNDQARREISSFGNYTHKIDTNIVKYISRYSDLSTLLFFYQFRNIPFPLSEGSSNSIYFLDIRRTNFSTSDLITFYQMGGIIRLTKDYNINCHDLNLEHLLGDPQYINNLGIHLDILNQTPFREEHLRLVQWKYYRIEFIDWLVSKFGQVTIEKQMRLANFDYVKHLILNGQFTLASRAIKCGFSKSFDITSDLVMVCKRSEERSILQIKNEMQELLIHLSREEILSLFVQRVIKEHKTCCWISFVDRYFH